MSGGVTPAELPAEALLRIYADNGAFADAYATQVPFAVSLARLVSAFYNSPAFRAERVVLDLAGYPASDADVGRLASGVVDAFSAWTVEARTTDELLLRDATGRTRSWLRVEPVPGANATRLYFGSAVVPRAVGGGEPRFGPLFGALLGFHRFYSRVLLGSARKRLLRE